MADLRHRSCITEDNPQMKLDESTTVSCETLSDSRNVSEAKDNNDSDDKKTNMIALTYDCLDCPKSYGKSSLLFKHTNEQHGGRKCPDCDKRFNLSSPYHLHIKKHTGLRYLCIKCGHKFNTKSNLITHTNIHLGIKPYQCSKCELSFSDRSACNRHEKIHSRGGNYETFCSVCGKGLAIAGRLEEHMKTHGGRKFSHEEKVEAVALARRLGVRKASDQLQVLALTLANWVKLVSRPVTCTQCSYITYTAFRLRKHEKNMHGSSDLFPCQLCDVRTKNKESLRKHMRRAHDKEIVKTEDTTKLQDMKEHDCPACGNSFSRKKLLRDHLKACKGSTVSKNSDKIYDKTSDTISDKTSEKATHKVSKDISDKSQIVEPQSFALGLHTSVKLQQNH